jgi:hypothetical protein
MLGADKKATPGRPQPAPVLLARTKAQGNTRPQRRLFPTRRIWTCDACSTRYIIFMDGAVFDQLSVCWCESTPCLSSANEIITVCSPNGGPSVTAKLSDDLHGDRISSISWNVPSVGWSDINAATVLWAVMKDRKSRQEWFRWSLTDLLAIVYLKGVRQSTCSGRLISKQAEIRKTKGCLSQSPFSVCRLYDPLCRAENPAGAHPRGEPGHNRDPQLESTSAY